MFVVLSWLLPAATAAAAEPAELVPQDVALYVELTDPARVIDRLLAPDIVDMLDSIPQFRQFKQSDAYAQLRATVAYMEGKLDTDWRRAISDLSGRGAVLAVSPGNPDYAVLVVRAKDPDLLRRTNKLLIDMVENDAREKGKPSPVKSKDYKGVTVWSLGKDEFHAIIGDTLVVSNKQDGMKTVVEMNAGEGPASIAASAGWKAARQRVPRGAVGWAYARLEAFRQAGFAKDFYAEKAPNPGIPVLFGGLGHLLREAPYGVAALELDDQRLALRIELPRDGKPWPEAFRGIYAAERGREAPVPLRPARTIASLSVHRDLKAMWDARDQLVAAEALPQLAGLENDASPVLFGDREFANEVLGQFEPGIRVVVAGQNYSRADVVPHIKLPAFALVAQLKNPDDFSTDLTIGYQSILGILNVQFGQQKQPRFLQSQQDYRGLRINSARFYDRTAVKRADDAAHLRYNFSPSCSIAGRYFVLGSTAEIVRDVIDSLGDPNAPPKTTEHNVVLDADISQLVDLLVQNREPLVNQNMVQQGNTREKAEQEVDLFLALFRLFGKGRFTWTAEPDSMHADLSIEFAKPLKAARR
jgi:hypothetical protein